MKRGLSASATLLQSLMQSLMQSLIPSLFRSLIKSLLQPVLVSMPGPLVLSACASHAPMAALSNAQLTPATQLTRELRSLPEPKGKIVVAVYGFRDQTGQFKPSPDSSFSTAVTQGAASMLQKALRDSGWFSPVEREGLQNLLTERKIIRALETPGDKNTPPINLPQLTPASILIEGGIIAYESNVRTGGGGARYLGVGGSTQYRVDQVTINLRSVDIRSGNILNNVSTTKTIYSYEVTSGVFRFVNFMELLELEAGVTRNEPAQMCVKEAIEAGVMHLIVQGLKDQVWVLKNTADITSPLLQRYLKEEEVGITEPAAPVRKTPFEGWDQDFNSSQ